MLRVVAIEQITPRRYLVSIDRDGQVRQYVFGALAPLDGVVGVSPSQEFLDDIDDYLPKGQTERPIPGPRVLRVPCDLVAERALGHEVSLPVILDER